MLLYRTESSLAHSFREGQVLAECRALVEMDQQVVFQKDYTEQGGPTCPVCYQLRYVEKCSCLVGFLEGNLTNKCLA